MKVIILAAGRGSRMNSATSDKPKCMIPFEGSTIIQRSLDTLMKIFPPSDLYIVGGYKLDLLENFGVKLLENHLWESTNIMGSLLVADQILSKSKTLVVYSDIVFDASAPELMKSGPVPGVLSLRNWNQIWSTRFIDPLVDVEGFKMENGIVKSIGGRAQKLDEIEGQFGGMFTTNPSAWATLKKLKNLEMLDTTTALNQIVQKGVAISVVPYAGFWAEFDSMEDINKQGYKN